MNPQPLATTLPAPATPSTPPPVNDEPPHARRTFLAPGSCPLEEGPVDRKTGNPIFDEPC